MIYYGIPKCTHTRSKKILLVASIVIFFLQAAAIMAIFENLPKNHKNAVISMLIRRKAQHVIHGDGFPRSTRGRQRSIEALLLDGQFGSGTGKEGFDVLPDILSKIRPIEILL